MSLYYKLGFILARMQFLACSKSVPKRHFPATCNLTYLGNRRSDRRTIESIGLLEFHYPYVALSLMSSWPNDVVVQLFPKLVFCPVHFNANLALVGQLWKTLDRASVGGIPTSALPIHTCRSRWHAFCRSVWFFAPGPRLTDCP